MHLEEKTVPIFLLDLCELLVMEHNAVSSDIAGINALYKDNTETLILFLFNARISL